MPESWGCPNDTGNAPPGGRTAGRSPFRRAEREACVTLADGYDKLAEIIEAQRACR